MTDEKMNRDNEEKDGIMAGMQVAMAIRELEEIVNEGERIIELAYKALHFRASRAIFATINLARRVRVRIPRVKKTRNHYSSVDELIYLLSLPDVEAKEVEACAVKFESRKGHRGYDVNVSLLCDDGSRIETVKLDSSPEALLFIMMNEETLADIFTHVREQLASIKGKMERLRQTIATIPAMRDLIGEDGANS